MNRRRRLLVQACAAALAMKHIPISFAQAYPGRPIKIIVPASAGGITDVEVRRLAPHLSKALGQPVIIDNRPGASNTIGTAMGAKAPPDGYTLTWGSFSGFSVAPALMANLPYDPVKDFEPVAHYGRVPMVLVVHPSLGVTSVQDLIAMAKSKPGQLNYASNGPAASMHVMGELFKLTAGVNILHVPYKAAAPALVSVLANETQMCFDFPVTCTQHVKAGKLKALMVTSRKPIPVLPVVPAAAQAGYPQLELMLWGGLLAPRGTPKDIVLRLNSEMLKIARMPEMIAIRESMGSEAGVDSPEEFQQVIVEELAKWRHIIKTTGIKMEG